VRNGVNDVRCDVRERGLSSRINQRSRTCNLDDLGGSAYLQDEIKAGQVADFKGPPPRLTVLKPFAVTESE
jgi:hypothetical protein